MSTGWTFLLNVWRINLSLVRTWKVPSESRSGVTYIVTLHLADKKGFRAGSFSCDCMAWRFQRRPVSERICKHIKSVTNGMLKVDQGFNAIKEIQGSEVTFEEEAVENGRLEGLIDGIMKMNQ